jgi:aspartate--ammonia ligase
MTDRAAGVIADKKAALARPGTGSYEELEKVLHGDYRSILDPRDTQHAIFAVKGYIEEHLCRELNLMMVQVPLIVDVESGVNDMLDRDGSRTPIQFHISNDRDRNLDFLKRIVRKIWTVLKGAETHVQSLFPALRTSRYPSLPDELEFFHAEEILERYPDLPRKQRETMILEEHPAVFIIGIGWILADGYPHKMRAADYDDWVTETRSPDGRPMHGLNGDILVWNPVTKRRHELTSMGIRVNAATLRQQLEITGQLDFLKLPYHQGILSGELPLSIGGGIGQSRTQMLLLKKAHLGEVSVTVWPKVLKEMCRRKNIVVLD